MKTNKQTNKQSRHDAREVKSAIDIYIRHKTRRQSIPITPSRDAVSIYNILTKTKDLDFTTRLADGPKETVGLLLT